MSARSFSVSGSISLTSLISDVFNPEKETVLIFDIELNSKRDLELIALAGYEESETINEVYKVWRANRKTGKFEEVKDLSNITVINEDY